MGAQVRIYNARALLVRGERMREAAWIVVLDPGDLSSLSPSPEIQNGKLKTPPD